MPYPLLCFTFLFYVLALPVAAAGENANNTNAAYTPTLDRLYRQKQSPAAAGYRLQTEEFGTPEEACLTILTEENGSQTEKHYRCTYAPLNKTFGLSRVTNGGHLPEMSATFSRLRGKDGDNVALTNSGSILRLYADFIENTDISPAGRSIFVNRGKIDTAAADFVGNRITVQTDSLSNQKPEANIALNDAKASVSALKAQFVDNRIEAASAADGKTAVLANNGNIAQANILAAGNKIDGNAEKSGVIVNSGRISSLSGSFSANKISGSGSVILNHGNIDYLQADFVNNRQESSSTEKPAGGSAIRLEDNATLYLIKDSRFVKNLSVSRTGDVHGGAVSIRAPFEGSLTNTVFLNNKAMAPTDKKAVGGAVYTDQTTVFRAEDGFCTKFSGNMTVSGSMIDRNALYADNGASVLFSARNGGSFVFDDNIRGQNHTLYFTGDNGSRFTIGNLIADAKQIVVRNSLLLVRKGAFGRGCFSALGELGLTDSRLDFHNQHRDRLQAAALTCQNCEVDIDVDAKEMIADMLEISDRLPNTVRINVHLSEDADIRDRKPVVFAVSESFAANRQSFVVNKVYGSSRMFDILYKEEDGGLKKSWSLIMNDHANPNYQTDGAAAEENNNTVPETADKGGKKEKIGKLPDCNGNIGCLAFKTVGQITKVVFLIVHYSRRVTNTTLTAIEKALFSFMEQINKGVRFFAPEPEPAPVNAADGA